MNVASPRRRSLRYRTATRVFVASSTASTTGPETPLPSSRIGVNPGTVQPAVTFAFPLFLHGGISACAIRGQGCSPIRNPYAVVVTSTELSQQLFDRAETVVPGGVNSPVRAFRAVGGTPRFMASAQGPYLTDVDGNEYVDLICSWGPMLLGHAHPAVIEAVTAAARRGTSYGTPTRGEVELAEEIVARTPVDQARLGSSGTQATMSAIPLARGFTRPSTGVQLAPGHP